MNIYAFILLGRSTTTLSDKITANWLKYYIAIVYFIKILCG